MVVTRKVAASRSKNWFFSIRNTVSFYPGWRLFRTGAVYTEAELNEMTDV